LFHYAVVNANNIDDFATETRPNVTGNLKDFGQDIVSDHSDLDLSKGIGAVM